MSDEAASLGRRWFEEVWNDRQDAAIDELMARDAVGHMEGGDVHGPDEFRAARKTFLDALPDLRIEVEEILSEGNRAAVRWHATGSHQGQLFDIAPSGASIDLRGTSWLVARDGKLVEGIDTWNLGGMLEALRAAAARATTT